MRFAKAVVTKTLHALGPVGFLSYIFFNQSVCVSAVLLGIITGRDHLRLAQVVFSWPLPIELVMAPGSRAASTEPRTMFLCNHRAWGDFILDPILTGGSILSRAAVGAVLPGSFLLGVFYNFCWFFRRGTGRPRSWYTDFTAEMWSRRPNAGLVVFPEGHRNQTQQSLRLKQGMIEVAYNLKVPVQVVITTRKEELLDEKRLRVAAGTVRCVAATSEVINPAAFETPEEWTAAVQETWDSTWNIAYGADPAECKTLPGESTRLIPIFPQQLDRARVFKCRAALAAAISCLCFIIKRD